MQKRSERAENWKWSSLYKRIYGDDKQKELLDEWPIDIPKDYLDLVNIQEDEKEKDFKVFLDKAIKITKQLF